MNDNLTVWLKLFAWAYAPVTPVFAAYLVWMPTAWATFGELNPLQKFTALLCGVGMLWSHYRMWKVADRVESNVAEDVQAEVSN